MNYLDIIFIILLVWFVVKGFKKGFILMLFTLLALAAGSYAALHYSDDLVTLINQQLHYTNNYLSITCFVFIFIIVLLLVYVIGKIIEGIINLAMLGLFNKLLGALLGIAKTIVIAGVLIYLIEAYDTKPTIVSKHARESSYSYPTLSKIVYWTCSLINISIKK